MKEQKEYFYLTTIDNPYDPCTEFEKWFAFDTEKGYNTCGYLDKIARTSPELSPEDNRFAVNAAVDEIIDINLSGMYKKVVHKF